MTKKGLYNTQSSLGVISIFFAVGMYYLDFKFSSHFGIDKTQNVLNVSAVILIIFLYVALKIFKYDETSFNKMMLMMDVVPSCFFIILFIFMYSQAILFSEFAVLFEAELGWYLLVIALVSFFYGIYYGGIRWHTAISKILYDADNGKVKIDSAFRALIGNSNKNLGSTWVYGVVAVISPVIAKIYGHEMVLFLASTLLTPVIPIHIASILVRRYLFHKHIAHKKLILI